MQPGLSSPHLRGRRLSLKTNKWFDEFLGGKDFEAFLKVHQPEIAAFIKEIGL